MNEFLTIELVLSGIFPTNVVPRVRVLELCYTAFPVTGQEDTPRQIRDVMRQDFVRVYFHGIK